MQGNVKTQLLIIGSGPAGCTAAIYAVRAGIKTVQLLGSQPGGQLTSTSEVENFPGFPDFISGYNLMEGMQQQAKKLGVDQVYDEIVDVDFSQKPFIAISGSGDQYHADAIIIATGAKARYLGVPGEETFRGKGVSYCATCDGFFFRGKRVAIIGGGNTAVEEARYLSGLANHVTLIHRRNELRADKADQERLFTIPNISVVWDSVVTEITGKEESHITNVHLKNIKTNKTDTIDIDGIFVAIGHTPSTDVFISKLDLDSEGYISVNKFGQTSVDGIFAAGDVVSGSIKQAVVAASSGCIAANFAKQWLEGCNSFN